MKEKRLRWTYQIDRQVDEKVDRHRERIYKDVCMEKGVDACLCVGE